MGMNNKSQNGGGAKVALCAHPTHTHVLAMSSPLTIYHLNEKSQTKFHTHISSKIIVSHNFIFDRKQDSEQKSSKYSPNSISS
jgi:hypothetical protein